MSFLPSSITNLKAGNHHTFSLLYDAYAVTLFSRILKEIPDRAEAADILQETFIKVWRKIDLYDPGKGTLFTWMATIAHRTCLDHRDRVARALPFQDGQAYEYYASPDLPGVGIAAFIQKLEKKIRDVMVLYYYRGYTNSEVAVLLRIPTATVKSRRRKGLTQLKKQFYSV